MFFLFILSGLFLGWSLGANDAANAYGTAVGTRMIKFRTAAIACSVFVILGAVVSGAGPSDTLGELGAVNALPGSFTVALAAALTVTGMTRLKLPVSTSQAIVGGIIGWNFFSQSLTDITSLTKIVSSWFICPILAAVFSILLFKLAQLLIHSIRVHLFRIDVATRYGLVVVGAFASYSLGANNIANVMGVFVPAAPFGVLDVFGLFTLNAEQQLFLLGGIAIAIGVFTYSKRVMLTVGDDLFRLSPIAALIVVLAQALVLFLFSSEGLEHWLSFHGLPTIPLVPVSSSQAVIAAVVGIGIAKGGRNIKFGVLSHVFWGWVSTPVISGAVSFVLLFFVQNVFSQKVFAPVHHELSPAVVVKLTERGVFEESLADLVGQRFESAVAFRDAVAPRLSSGESLGEILDLSRVQPLEVDLARIDTALQEGWLTDEQNAALIRLDGRRFRHAWQLDDALAGLSSQWRPKPAAIQNKLFNKDLRAKLERLHRSFATELQAAR
ncbi:MAG: inorganic phosphate transporter [Candidatus Thorarchaeota archaeon]